MIASDRPARDVPASIAPESIFPAEAVSVYPTFQSRDLLTIEQIDNRRIAAEPSRLHYVAGVGGSA